MRVACLAFLFGPCLSLGATLETRNVSEAQPFWLSPSGRSQPRYDVEAQSEISPWQTRYSWTPEKLMLGGLELSANSPLFTRNSTCTRQGMKSPWQQSSWSFCPSSDRPPGVWIENEKAAARGFLALNPKQALKVEFILKNGAALTLVLFQPDETAWDVESTSKDDWTLLQAKVGRSQEWLPLMAESYPRKPQSEEKNLQKFPSMLELQDSVGVTWQRLIASAQGWPRTASERVQLANPKRRLATYSDHLSFKLVHQNTIHETQTDFEEEGSRELEVKVDNKNWRIDAYRMPPRELGIRLSGLSSQQESLFLMTGDASFSYFFEGLPAAQFEDWNSHRWALRGRAYGGLTQLSGLKVADPPHLFFGSLEGRMLIQRGLWNLDEIWGVLLSAGELRFVSDQARVMGVGAFWARSMPEGLDRWMRQFSWFRYPKYVDLDVTYFQPMESTGASPSPGWAANFHGKMFFSRSWFFEAGFGALELQAARGKGLSVVSGTLGLGLLF